MASTTIPGCITSVSGDYSEWFRSKIKDADLAGEAERVEKQPDLAPKDSRAAIREAVERRYTLPSEPAEYAQSRGGQVSREVQAVAQRRHHPASRRPL